VLTLWATVVAKALYHYDSLEEALSVGSAFSSLVAKGKGKSLGIYNSQQKIESKSSVDSDTTDIKNNAASSNTAEVASQKVGANPTNNNNSSSQDIELMGQIITFRVINGVRRAWIDDNKEQDPFYAWKYLQKRFGDGLGFVLKEMEIAAEEAGDDLAFTAYQYYIHIRPDIPEGIKGWGAHGTLKISKLRDFYPIQKSNR